MTKNRITGRAVETVMLKTERIEEVISPLDVSRSFNDYDSIRETYHVEIDEGRELYCQVLLN